jgi:hypothetical protein
MLSVNWKGKIMMAKVLTNNFCNICGIPLDAEYFDVYGLVGNPNGNGDLVNLFEGFELNGAKELPQKGEHSVLSSFQLHPQYCGVLSCFAQYTDLYARDNSQILTPGFEWVILQNGKPVFPYMRLEMIVNPWGFNFFQVSIRLDENAKVEFVLSNRSVRKLDDYPIKAFGGRISGRYWYNQAFGGRVR